MRRILYAPSVTILIGLAAPALAAEPGSGVLARGREVVQACFHRCCEPKCGPSGAACGACDEDALKIGKLICELDSGRRGCDRKRAVGRLEGYNWQCHPEIVAALLGCMQGDCDPCVREKAADSLADMRACAPEVVDAMRMTACSDPDRCVRHRAERGIRQLEACRPPCLTYVSGYPSACSSGCAAGQPDAACPIPGLDRVPEPPRPMPPEPRPEEGSMRSSVRSFFSTAVARVKSRL